MALWFDATELTIWHHHQLTGIQRTTVGVLTPLLSLYPDIKLFKYDHLARSFCEIYTTHISLSIRNVMASHMHGSDLLHALDDSRCIMHIPVNPPSISEPPPISPIEKNRKKRVRLLERVTRRAPPDVREAALAYRVARKRLRKSTYRWLKGLYFPQRRRSVVPNSPLGSDSKDPRAPDSSNLFSPGDVVLSLSPSWALGNFAEDIGKVKRRDKFKFVVMIYDLIPTLFPHWVDDDTTRLITRWLRQQIRNADVVLAISRFQKTVIDRYSTSEGLGIQDVQVVRLGDDPVNLLSNVSTMSLPRYVPQRPFVLCTSTIDVRKNHRCLYEVWRRLGSEYGLDCLQLVLVGLPHLHVKELLTQMVRDPLTNNHIVVLSDVNDTEMAWYLRNCRFTIYPSEYEGWGLPVSESLRAGKYCIASNASSIPEIGGDLVDYFDPIDYLGCYNLVKRAIEDKDYVERRERQLKNEYIGARWSDTADHIGAIMLGLSSEEEAALV